MSPDSCLSIHMYLRLLGKIHVSRSVFKHPYVSQGPLRDPCLRIHVSASLYLRFLYKIHVFGFMSQHLCISGFSTRSTSSDSCLSIFVSQAPLQDPCLRIHVSASIYISGTSARFMSPDPYISIHMYLRVLCKIHVSGFMSHIHVYLRILCKIHVFGFMSQHPLIWILCKIHVFGFMSQHLYISGPSARSMSSDSCLSIFESQDPLQDPCVRFMS